MATTTDNSPDLLSDFIDEAVDSLVTLPDELNSFRNAPHVEEPINAVFRAVHSIKGCAGFLGLVAVKQFSHALENTLDHVRHGDVLLNEDLQRAIVHGFDLLEEMLQDALSGNLVTQLDSSQTELLDQVHQLANACRVGGANEQAIGEELLSLAEAIAALSDADAMPLAEKTRQLAVRFGERGDQDDAPPTEPGLGRRPATSFRDTPLFCTISERREDVTSHVAPLLELFLAVERNEYRPETGEGFLAAAECFVGWARQAELVSLAETVAEAAADFRTIYDSPLDVDETLLSIVWDQIWPELTKMEGASPAQDSTPSSADSPGSSTTPSEPSPAVAAPSTSARKSRVVRVKEERLDGFLDKVSNLFITCELFKDLHARLSKTGQLAALVDELRQVNHVFATQSTELQQSIAALRRVPIAGLFSKFPRMARSLAKNLGKVIDVHVSGEDVEIDKSLVEDLDAPLTHMIRNVVDHGIETPQERQARGVDETGNLWLMAELTRHHVLITVRDDGRGIAPEVLREKAIEKGIHTRQQADALGDQEAVELIFHAGLSTAKEISDVSGRGVGLDVVRSNLAEHDGQVHVTSQLGQGTTFRLEIPLRKAVTVIDGLMLHQNGESFVVPFDNVLEITEIDAREVNSVQGTSMVTVRGRTYPAYLLSDLLDLPDQTAKHADTFPGVLVGCKQGEMCLLVEQIVGHRQVVVNSIGEMTAGSDNITGVAQLGGGRLALVLSVPDLVQRLGIANANGQPAVIETSPAGFPVAANG